MGMGSMDHSAAIGIFPIVKFSLRLGHFACGHHAGRFAIGPKCAEQMTIANRAPERIESRCAILPFAVGQETDRKGIFQRFLKFARLDFVQVELHIDQVKFHVTNVEAKGYRVQQRLCLPRGWAISLERVPHAQALGFQVLLVVQVGR